MQEYELKLQEYNKNTEVKKKAFEQDKKLKIAQTIISTITGVVSAVTGMISAVPGPVGIVLGALAGVAVAVMGAVQVAAISKQKFDAGTPPAAPKLTHHQQILVQLVVLMHKLVQSYTELDKVILILVLVVQMDKGKVNHKRYMLFHKR